MLKLKLQYFGHLMWRTDSFEKTLMLGKIEGRRRLRGLKRMRWLDGITNSVDMSLSKLRDGQGGLVCCSPWACKELDTTEWLNWTELLYLIHRLPFLLLHKSYIYSQSFSLLSVLSLWWSPLSHLAVTSLQKTVTSWSLASKFPRENSFIISIWCPTNRHCNFKCLKWNLAPPFWFFSFPRFFNPTSNNILFLLSWSSDLRVVFDYFLYFWLYYFCFVWTLIVLYH